MKDHHYHCLLAYNYGCSTLTAKEKIKDAKYQFVLTSFG
jgi:hypothetical protein